MRVAVLYVWRKHNLSSQATEVANGSRRLHATTTSPSCAIRTREYISALSARQTHQHPTHIGRTQCAFHPHCCQRAGSMHGARVVEDSGIACRASSAGAKRRWPNNSRFRRRTRSSRTALVGAVAEASSGVRNGTLGAYSARDGPRGSIRIGAMSAQIRTLKTRSVHSLGACNFASEG